MNGTQKENIKRIVNSGLKQIMSNLNISNPSSKLETAIKKHAKKLIADFKREVKRMSKTKTKNNHQLKSTKKRMTAKKLKSVKPVKPVSKKVT